MSTRKQRKRRKNGIPPAPKPRQSPAPVREESYFERRQREAEGLMPGPSYHWVNPNVRKASTYPFWPS